MIRTIKSSWFACRKVKLNSINLPPLHVEKNRFYFNNYTNRSLHSMAASHWTHLARFISEEDGQIHVGQIDSKKYPDVGLAVLNGEKVAVKLIKGSIFDGIVSDTTLHVSRVSRLLPL
jgi:hypothetical protein